MALEFRKEALKKLSSPDDFDRLMPVTDSRGWIALLAGGILFLSVLMWGFFGKVQTLVQGEGITMRTGVITGIPVRSSGIIKDFTLRGGDSFVKGVVLAHIDQPELCEALDNASAEVKFIREHQKEQLFFLQKTIASLSERISRLNALFRDGLIEKQIISGAEQDLMVAKNKLYDLEDKVAAANRRFILAQYNYRLLSTVLAPFSGVVTEVEYNNGDFINTGEELLQTEQTDKPDESERSLFLNMYVSAKMVKKIQCGMQVFIAPSTVKPEEYGHMIGKVFYISQYPKTYQSIKADLNDELAKRFVANGAPYKIKVKIQADPSALSGYRWTSGKGPRTQITSGILCNGLISVEDQRPIDLVIPVFKKYVLGQGS